MRSVLEYWLPLSHECENITMKRQTGLSRMRQSRASRLRTKPVKLSLEHLETREMPASLSGMVYIDQNFDGIRQSSEPGLSGVTIQLTGTDANGAVDRSVTTGSDGSWNFNNLLAGTYTLTQTQPSGFLTAFETVGTAGGTPSSNTFSDITLTADQDGINYLFGEQGITLSGTVFNDANANGNLDGGETGFAGILITLTNTSNSQTFPTLSDASGQYSFAGLAPGNYTVTASNTNPSLGFSTPSTYTVNITNNGLPGGVLTNQNFGLSQVGSLSGAVYIDANNNGIRDPGEAGIAGVTMLLSGVQANSEFINRTITTGADGSFQFNGLLAGTYNLTQTQPNGFADGIITVGSAGGTAGPNVIVGIHITPGTQATGYLFGELQNQVSSLSGRVYIDLNRDGFRQPNEPGISGVTIQITGTDIFGAAVNRSTTTSADGSFSFNDLLPGTYSLAQTQPTGFPDGITTAGSEGGMVNGNVISNIVLAGDVNATDYLFGEFGIRVSGNIFNDTNANGVRDLGESGRTGVTVQLRNTATGVITPFITDVNGNYFFDDLAPGNYQISVVNPTGFLPSSPSPLTVNITNSGVAGGQIINQDIGLAQVSRISGFVYIDLNNNGIRNVGEPGISGVTITLNGLQANGQQVTRTITTAADGSYHFNDLLAGTYSLTQTQPNNFDDGAVNVGTAGGTAGVNVITNIGLGSNVQATGYNFGEIQVQLVSLTGVVFIDLNNDGNRQATEIGIANVVMQLSGVANNGDQVDLTVSTNSNGIFTFTNLRAGTYTLTQIQPANFATGITRAGTAGGIVDGDVISNIVLTGLVNATNYRFGERGITISGSVFNDLNANGEFDAGELGRSGVTVILRNIATGAFAARVSSATGAFQFENIGPGNYTLSINTPVGFLVTSANLNINIPNDGVLGGALTEQDIGLAASSSLSGLVFLDANGDGVKQNDEPALSNITMQLAGTQANGQNLTRTIVTNSNGTFLFQNVLAGTYNLSVTPNNGFVTTSITIGTAGGEPSGDVVNNLNLGVGQNATGYVFAQQPINDRSLITGRVYVDRNVNGRFDAGDIGIENVIVQLRGRDENGQAVVNTVLTDFNGNYVFGNLRPGVYHIIEFQPRGFGNGRTSVGTRGGLATTNIVQGIQLSAGDIASGYDFGEILPLPSRRYLIASRYWM